jgi:hypothetical protein
MTRGDRSKQSHGRDDADARGDHIYERRPAGRSTVSAEAAERDPNKYAAGADGTQRVNSSGEGSVPLDAVPPSPITKNRVQPPPEPEK